MYGAPQNFSQLVENFIDVLSLIVPVLFSLSLLFIVWKIIDAWVIHSDEPAKVQEGKTLVIVGIVVLVIMSGIWGVLRILRGSLFGV